MISDKIKKKLMENWGAKAEAMDCFCELKLFYLDSNWSCYIFAMNPDDDDEIRCIISVNCLALEVTYSFRDILISCTAQGENPIVDEEFRPIKANELFKKLNGGL